MAAQQHDHHRGGFPGEDEDLDEDDDDVLDEDDANSASTTSSLPTATPVAPTPSSVTVAVPSASIALNGADPLLASSSSIPVSSSSGPVAVIATPVPLRIETTPPDSRKLFQRLWTDEDEIELLQGFFEFTSQRGGVAVAGGPGHHDTSLFYDQIKSKLQLDFNKNQLIEKLRRLKKKYRNVVNKISSGKDVSFKSPHDRATFEISRKIWTNITASRGPQNDGFDDDDDNNDNNNSFSLNPNFANASPNFNSPNPNPNPNSNRPIYEAILLPSNPRKRPRSQTQAQPVKVEEKSTLGSDGPAGLNGVSVSSSLSGVIEETVRSCLSPVFKELLNGGIGFAGISGVPAPFNLNSPSFLSLGGLSSRGYGVEAVDERWRKQQILELEVYSKRLELVQEQIRAKLEELRSAGR